MSKKRVWFVTGAGRGMGVEFVTGAGRGMGVELVKAALAAGNSVVATGRNPDAPTWLTSGRSGV